MEDDQRVNQFLADCGARLHASLDVFVTLATIADLAVPTLADWCILSQRDEDGDIRHVLMRAADTRSASRSARIARMLGRFSLDPDGTDVIARVLRSGQAELLPDPVDALLPLDASATVRRLLGRLGATGGACVPLRARGQAVGTITLLSATPVPFAFDDAALHLAEEFGARAGLALDNARLLGEALAAKERASLLNTIGRTLRASLDPDEIMQTTAEQVGEALGASRCLWVWLSPSGNGFHVSPRQWTAEGVARRESFHPYESVPAPIMDGWRRGEMGVVHDFAQAPALAGFRPLTRPEEAAIRAAVTCPVSLRGEWAGLFVVQQTGKPRRWTANEISFIQQAAEIAAPALANARLYAREHRVAEMLQAAFLTDVPDQIGGLQFATTYRAGLSEAQVGGDMYDAFPLPGGRVGIVMADVSGKGLDAAVLTATVKFTLRAFASEGDAPASVLTRLNKTLAGGVMGEHFVTLFFGVFDDADGTLRYASAGHETQFVRRANGGATLLGATGPILGIADWQFVERMEALAVGDTIVLYTDGLTEARDPQTRRLLELSRVIEIATACSDGTGPGAIAALLEATAVAWAQGQPHDDIALLVARRGSSFHFAPPPGLPAAAVGFWNG